jgi:hypothetical protein
MKRFTFIACLAALALAGAPAFAQDESGDAAAEADAPAEGAEAADVDAAPPAGEAADGEAAEGEAAEGEATEGEATEGVEGVPTDVEGGTAAPPKLGPGGRPLRTDYPGTEESLQERMDTNKIEGFEVDPNAPSEAYGLRIKELETKIDDLKEKVFQSKTRIVLLRETLLSGAVGGSQAIIIHRTDLGPAFKLRQAIYSLDGTRVFSEVDNDGSLADKTSFEVFNGTISPGNHNLSVYLRYQGSGYGVFNYFDGYDFEMRNSCTVPGKEGKIAVVTSKAVAQGNITTSKENEPSLECTVSYRDTKAAAAESGGEDDAAPAGDAAESTDE